MVKSKFLATNDALTNTHQNLCANSKTRNNNKNNCNSNNNTQHPDYPHHNSDRGNNSFCKICNKLSKCHHHHLHHGHPHHHHECQQQQHPTPPSQPHCCRRYSGHYTDIAMSKSAQCWRQWTAKLLVFVIVSLQCHIVVGGASNDTSLHKSINKYSYNDNSIANSSVDYDNLLKIISDKNFNQKLDGKFHNDYSPTKLRPQPIYLNQFAVYIPSGVDAANTIADQYGFTNGGQVSVVQCHIFYI
jgi:hypothetical protein